jgi:hypothetical protein
LTQFVTRFRVYDLRDSEDRVFAFEVNNTFFRRSEVATLVSKIPGARVVKRPHFLRWRDDDQFCEWVINSVTFAAEEPFGDNSRYWIGPISPTGWVPEIEIVRDAFVKASARKPVG